MDSGRRDTVLGVVDMHRRDVCHCPTVGSYLANHNARRFHIVRIIHDRDPIFISLFIQ